MQLKNTNHHLHYLDWPAPKVLAFTTTRQSPFLEHHSADLTKFSAFNLGSHVGDKHENVVKNRRCLQSILPVNTDIQWFQQVHGSDVAVITSYSDQAIVADAAITKQKNIALAIMTADCLPILLSTKQGDEIAAIHGGWRPLVDNIIAKTIAKMSAAPNEIVAWLGPCIGADSFEVGVEVKQQFIKNSPMFEQAFIKQSATDSSDNQIKDEKYLANLALIATLQLNQLGVSNVSLLPHCTFSKETEYFSYRRDGQTGRMATVICRT